MSGLSQITSPTDAAFDALCESLRQAAEASDAWPSPRLQECADRGLFRWFAPEEYDGASWSGADIVEANLRLAGACLTTTFVLTQLTGALRRLASGANEPIKREVLPDLVAGKRLATLGISHLTTSRQHLRQPALTARSTQEGYRFNGLSPWVTGGAHANFVLTGAICDNGQQLLALVPTDLPGVSIPPPQQLVALNGSHTGPVHFSDTLIEPQWVLAGPAPEVMKQAAGARTGGLQTSTLALGLASAAIRFVHQQSQQRSTLIHPAEQLQAEWQTCVVDLRTAASGEECDISNIELRTRCNSLVLRATQAALSAAKGAGYVAGHPAGRWCQEALFFLVWSCPQQVVDANLCEFAGIQ